MENTLGTLNGAHIIQRALQLCFTMIPELKTVAMGFRDLDGYANEALLNQPVTSRIQGIPTVTDFGSAATAYTTTDVTCTMTGFKKVHHEFTPQEYNATTRQLIDESAMPMAIALAKHVLASVTAYWTFANYPKRLVQASAWDYDTIVDLRKAANKAGIPNMNRFHLVNSDVYAEYLRDPLIVGFLNNQRNADAITTGKLPDVSGFGLGEYPDLGGNSENLIGAAGTPDATMWLARAPKNPEEILQGAKFPGALGFVEEPITGFKVMVLQYIGTDLKVNNVICWLQGFTPGNTANLIRLVSANLTSDDGS